MHPILNIAIRAARKGGQILIKSYDNQKNSNEYKIINNDLVNNIIMISEKLMINIIRKAYPTHIILTNNQKIRIFQKSEIIWLINALDGVENFKKKLPHFCISIAVIIRNSTEVSVIYDPLRNELFTSVKGQGAQLNGYRMRCNNINTLNNSLMGTNFFYNSTISKNNFSKIINLLLLKNIHFRCTGCIGLDCTYLASGRLDCLLNFHLEPIILKAGYLQIKESGGLVSDLYGGHNYISSGSILMGNAKVMKIILVMIRDFIKFNKTTNN